MLKQNEESKVNGLWLIEGWRLSGGAGEHSDLQTKSCVETPGLFWEQTGAAHTHSHRRGMWVCPDVNAAFNPSPGHPASLAVRHQDGLHGIPGILMTLFLTDA